MKHCQGALGGTMGGEHWCLTKALKRMTLSQSTEAAITKYWVGQNICLGVSVNRLLAKPVSQAEWLTNSNNFFFRVLGAINPRSGHQQGQVCPSPGCQQPFFHLYLHGRGGSRKLSGVSLYPFFLIFRTFYFVLGHSQLTMLSQFQVNS